MSKDDLILTHRCSILLMFIGLLFLLIGMFNQPIIELLKAETSILGDTITGGNRIDVLACESLCCYWIGFVASITGIVCMWISRGD